MVGGQTFDESLKALGNFGRLVTFGMASRTPPSPIHPGALMHGSKTVSGFWLSNCFGKKELMADVLQELFQLITEKKLTPVIGASFSLDQAISAHRAMLARETVGKIVLKP